MKFFVIFILTFLISPTILSAANSYIKIGATKSKNQLRTIKSKLSKMGLTMIYKTTNTKYLVYSGPYKDEVSAEVALQKIQNHYPHAKILVDKSTKDIKQKKPTQVQTQAIKNSTNQKKDNSGYYVGVGLGYSSAPSTHTIVEGSVSVEEPNNSGMSYTIDGGYTFKNGFSISVGYMKFDASDIVFDNMYTALNYRFDDYHSFVPYFGVIGGYSSLKWSVDPIDNASDASNNDSDSFFGGSQAGAIYNGLDIISLYIGYQCIFMGHTTNIEVDSTNTSKLEHKTLHSLLFGIQYNF